MPARPGGTSIGITYCAVPCSDTLKLPGTAPTGLVTGSGSSGSGPSGVSIGGSAVGVRHCPEPVQYWPLGHEPQLWPQFGSAPQERPSHAGVHSGQAPQSASGPPQRGGTKDRNTQVPGLHVLTPSGRATQAYPDGHSASSLQPSSPGPHTPGQRPPQPSSGLPHVAAEQSGVQTQVPPHREVGVPQSAGSFEGQAGSTQASRESASRARPMSWRQTSPSGQVLVGSVTSQGVVQLQFEPQTLSASPHSRSGLVTRQLTGQQTRWERRRPKQPPLFSPHSRSAAQSRSLLHSSPVPQGGQLPPQSTAVSLPSLTPFVQCPGWHAGS